MPARWVGTITSIAPQQAMKGSASGKESAIPMTMQTACATHMFQEGSTSSADNALGMPRFADRLTREEVAAIQAWLLSRNRLRGPS